MIALLALLPLQAHAATLRVSNPADAGLFTLRHRISTAAPGDTIVFDPGVTHIDLVTPLPDIVDTALTIDGDGRVTLDGQHSVAGDGLVVRANGVVIIGLDVTSFLDAGIRVSGADNVHIGQMGASPNSLRDNGEEGIRVEADGANLATGVTLENNRVGLTVGDATSPNCSIFVPFSSCAGVFVGAGAPDAVVRNDVISGNLGDGLAIQGDRTLVSGNTIGLSASGAAARPNDGDGIQVSGGAFPNTSGDVEIQWNLIAANTGAGIYLADRSHNGLVTGGLIGLDAFGAVQGNGSHGIVTAVGTWEHQLGSTSLLPLVVVGNGGSGIVLNGRGHVVKAADVGSYDNVALGNAGYGIRVDHSGDAGTHTIGDALWPNVVSANDLGGIWVDDDNVTVAHNIVGLGRDGTTLQGNGSNPLSLGGSFGGILVTAGVPDPDDRPVVTDNVVAANHGPGIWIRGGSHEDPTRDVLTSNNLVGLTAALGGAGNLEEGIRIEGASHVEVSQSDIADNLGEGIAVLDLPGHTSVGVVISDNAIGVAGLGNGANGVLLDGEEGSGVIECLVVDNSFTDNAGYGVFSGDGALDNEISANDFDGNGSCPVSGTDDANLGSDWPAPEVESVVSGDVTLTWEARSGIALDRIEVYVGAADVAAYAGVATYDAVHDHFVPSGTSVNDVRALAIAVSGNTSETSAVAGDGCTQSLCTQTDPYPDDYCTFDYWDGNSCETHVRPDGYRCNDGDVNTGIVRFGEDFGWPPAPGQDLPDHCVSGRCVGGTPTTDPMDCPFATQCNDPVRDAAANECRYASDCTLTEVVGGITYDVCEIDNLGGTSCGDGCSGCDLNGANIRVTDADGDLIPDHWEEDLTVGGTAPEYTRDWDCDGVADTDYPEGGSADARNVYLFIAWMSEECPEDPDAPGALDGIHHHRPDAAIMDELVERFDAGGLATSELEAYELTITEQCIPHYTQLTGHTGNNADPDCDTLDAHISLQELKARYFAPWRRGIYRFAIMGHSNKEDVGGITRAQQSDGKCTFIAENGNVGKGEIFGDDVRVAYQHRKDPQVDPGEPDHVAETSTLFHELATTSASSTIPRRPAESTSQTTRAP